MLTDTLGGELSTPKNGRLEQNIASCVLQSGEIAANVVCVQQKMFTIMFACCLIAVKVFV